MKHSIKKIITAAVAVATIGTSMFRVPGIVRADSDGIETFVTSLYVDCLGRDPDATGFNYWCGRLRSGEITGKQCAYGFFFSPEFTGKANSLNDTDYINVFYNVFLNRDYDTSGMAYWTDRISVTSYDTTLLFSGFSDSNEFRDKCARYGITFGSHIDVPDVVRSYAGGTSSSAPAAAPASSGGATSSGSYAAPAAAPAAPASASSGQITYPEGFIPSNASYEIDPNQGYIVPMNPSADPSATPEEPSVVYTEPATINATSVTLVVADERRTQEFTPEFAAAYAANKVDSFQLVVSNANRVTYRVISGDAEVSTTGLVTPGRNVWWTSGDSVWHANPRHTIPDDAVESRIDYFPGESVIRVTADGQTFDVNVTVVDYASEYTDSVLEQFIEANNLRSEDMSVQEKAYLITQYVAHNYDYSIYYGLSAEMVTHGSGDCIGSMNLIIRIANMIGLTAWPRDARSDWGAGSGHMNAVIYDGVGTYYVCDAGTSGTAPRAFIMGSSDTLPAGTYCN